MLAMATGTAAVAAKLATVVAIAVLAAPRSAAAMKGVTVAAHSPPLLLPQRMASVCGAS